MLSERQLQDYHRDGVVMVESIADPETLATMRHAFDGPAACRIETRRWGDPIGSVGLASAP